MKNTDRIQVLYETQDGRTGVMGGPGARTAEMRRKVAHGFALMQHRVRFRHNFHDRWTYLGGSTVEHFEKFCNWYTLGEK